MIGSGPAGSLDKEAPKVVADAGPLKMLIEPGYAKRTKIEPGEVHFFLNTPNLENFPPYLGLATPYDLTGAKIILIKSMCWEILSIFDENPCPFLYPGSKGIFRGPVKWRTLENAIGFVGIPERQKRRRRS